MRRAVLIVFGLLALAAPGVAAAADYAPMETLGRTGGGILRFPQAVAFDPAGRFVYVADQHSFLVQKLTNRSTTASSASPRISPLMLHAGLAVVPLKRRGGLRRA